MKNKIGRALQNYNINIIDTLALNDELDVYKILCANSDAYFLKIYTPESGGDYLSNDINEYHTSEQIKYEMEILNALKKFRLGTAHPLKNNSGAWVSEISSTEYAVITTFVEGMPFEKSSCSDIDMAYNTGAAAGRLHNASEAGTAKIAVRRPHRKQEYVKRMMACIEKGLKYKTLTCGQLKILEKGAESIMACMDELDTDMQKNVGLVHTDIRYANCMYSPNTAIPIDFERCVYGYHLYDLGEMCAHMGGAEIQSAILRGYNSVRPFEKGQLKMVQAFFVMFLMLVVAESIHKYGNTWLHDTIDKLAAHYIPQLEAGGIFLAACN